MSVTIEDVAEEADVSITTVSAVINDTRYVSPELTERVNEAIEELNYYPDQMGRGLRKGKSNAVGLLVSDITNPFFPRVARGMEDCARENHYNVILCNTDEDPVEEKHYIELLRSQRVDGAVVAPTAKGKENIEPLLEKSIPVVLIDRSLGDGGLPAVVSDNYSGAYSATEYLVSKGHRDIGFVGGIEGIQSTDRRYEGYRDALRDNKIDLKKSRIVMGNSQIKDSYRATKEVLESGEDITAIFAANNLILIGVLQYLRDNSISYPGEISVVCFDDPEWGSAVNPSITAVSQKPYEIGYEAGRRLFDSITNSEGRSVLDGKMVISTTLKERNSVKNLKQ